MTIGAEKYSKRTIPSNDLSNGFALIKVPSTKQINWNFIQTNYGSIASSRVIYQFGAQMK